MVSCLVLSFQEKNSFARIKICYARVNDEIADKGTFCITKDKNGDYSGTFTLQLSEGTMHGKFFID